jgi:hypothetical protein
MLKINSHRQRRTDDDDQRRDDIILKDGESLRVPMFLRDSSPNPSLSPMQRAVAATRLRMQADAMTMADASLHKPGYRFAPSGMTADQRQNMYDTYDQEISQNYKTTGDSDRTGRSNSGYGSSTGSFAPIAGSYPRSPGLREGSACTINGAPGTLTAIDGHPDWLECVADDADDNHADDSRSVFKADGTVDLQKAQAIKDAAYKKYDDDLQRAYLTKG